MTSATQHPPGDVGGALDAGVAVEAAEVVDGGDGGSSGPRDGEGTGDERVDVGEGEREAFAVNVVAVLVVCEWSPGEGDVRGVGGRATCQNR